MPFKKGQSGNPAGRQRGSRNRLTYTVLEAAGEFEKDEGKGAVDPLDLLQRVVSKRNVAIALRVQAAGMLAPYKHARKTARYISAPIDLPIPTTAAQAIANIAKIGELAAIGMISLDEANDLANVLKIFLDATVAQQLEERIIMIEGTLAKASSLAQPPPPPTTCGCLVGSA